MLNGSGCPFTHSAKRCIGIRSIKELPGQRQLETYVLISHLIASSPHLYRSIPTAPRGRASSSSQWLVYEFAARAGVWPTFASAAVKPQESLWSYYADKDAGVCDTASAVSFFFSDIFCYAPDRRFGGEDIPC